jgi:ubiquinone/menaquinone biosynthesis C-methylase UbiE
MASKDISETIENRWDILYAEYPEVYDRFARFPYRPTTAEFLARNFPLQGRTVADVGAGTGLSTLALARYAAEVIGLEPEAAMLAVARRAAAEQRAANVRFVRGTAGRMPLADGSVDIVTALTLASLHSEANIAAFDREASRLLRRGGHVLIVEVARGWYGGELAPILFRDTWEQEFDRIKEEILPRYGYRRLGFTSIQDYGTVENAVRTYGFIFGRAAIDYLREHRKSTIRWHWSVFHNQVAA